MTGRLSRSATSILTGLTVALVIVHSPVRGEPTAWTLEEVFKQAERATGNVKGIIADVAVRDVTGEETTTEGAGRAFVLVPDGRIRIDVSEGEQRTILCTGSDLFIYWPSELMVEEYDLDRHPQQLAPYALVGFRPSISSLKNDYLMTLLQEGDLDSRRVVQIELTPKKDEVRSVISRIHLWLDQSSWLPVQQRIYHSSAETNLTVQYTHVVRDDRLSSDLFKPNWPDGTRKVKK